MQNSNQSSLEPDDRIRANIAKAMAEAERETAEEARANTPGLAFFSGWKGWSILVLASVILWVIVS